MIITLILILIFYGASICGNSNNAIVTFEIDCFENEKYKSCSQECRLMIKVYIMTTNISLREPAEKDNVANYDIENIRGMCVKGIHDSRKNMNKIKINATIKGDILIYIKYITRENNIDGLFETHALMVKPSVSEKYHEMDLLTSLNSHKNIEMRFKIKLECLPHYYGEECEINCVNVPKHFHCNKNGSRNCSSGFVGEYCNKVKDCKYGNKCLHKTTECNSFCESKNCSMDLISLRENCFITSINSTGIGTTQRLTLPIQMPLIVLGGIILLLLVIIFIMGIYKIKRRVINPGIILARRPLPSIRQQSMMDDYRPPNASEYAEMCSQCPSQNDSSATYYPNFSLPIRAPYERPSI